jgi:UDP:flavonoid glycosyltransferase YjiC (YdhE family)
MGRGVPRHAHGPVDGVVIREYVPHSAVLPTADLLITHGGMGSLMAAFASGVPTVCVPLGRDQATNAERVVELGTSITLCVDASPARILEVVLRAMASSDLRQAARRMKTVVERYEDGRLAVEALERVVAGAEAAGADAADPAEGADPAA